MSRGRNLRLFRPLAAFSSSLGAVNCVPESWSENWDPPRETARNPSLQKAKRRARGKSQPTIFMCSAPFLRALVGCAIQVHSAAWSRHGYLISPTKFTRSLRSRHDYLISPMSISSVHASMHIADTRIQHVSVDAELPRPTSALKR